MPKAIITVETGADQVTGIHYTWDGNAKNPQEQVATRILHEAIMSAIRAINGGYGPGAVLVVGNKRMGIEEIIKEVRIEKGFQGDVPG